MSVTHSPGQTPITFNHFYLLVSACLSLATHQVKTEEVEDLPGVVLLQYLFERVLDESGQGLGRVLQGVAHEVIQWGSLRGVAHQGPLLAFLRRRRQDAVS